MPCPLEKKLIPLQPAYVLGVMLLDCPKHPQTVQDPSSCWSLLRTPCGPICTVHFWTDTDRAPFPYAAFLRPQRGPCGVPPLLNLLLLAWHLLLLAVHLLLLASSRLGHDVGLEGLSRGAIEVVEFGLATDRQGQANGAQAWCEEGG